MSTSFFPKAAPTKTEKGTRIWIAFSFIVSMSVILWAFTIPKRKAEEARLAAEMQANVAPVQLPGGVTVRADSPEEIQEAMRAIDHELMRAVARRQTEQRQPGPGLEEIRAKWQQRAERVERELRQFDQAVEGSIEWAYRQQLSDSLKDGPE